MSSNDDENGKYMLATASSEFLRDVLEGLGRRQKRIPSKYLYDARGSRLFEEICDADEYYVTRTETAILEDNAQAMAKHIGPRAVVIEPGAGNVTKAEILLNALDEPRAFMAIDVSIEHLRASVEQLALDFPDVEMVPVEGDFTRQFTVPVLPGDVGRRCVFFPGSTIGNFTPQEQRDILSRFRDVAQSNGLLLVGIDLIKGRDTLEAAYDDAQGVTAEFNRNVLRRIRRELDASVDPDAFEHDARFDDEHHRIEMHLVSRENQTLEIESDSFELEKGESILTEYSHKFDLDEFMQMALDLGLRHVESWTDEDANFAVVMLEPTPQDQALPR